MTEATLTSKGQVTIPQSVRERLGLHTGSRISFEVLPDGRIAITAVARFTIDDFIGCLPAPASTHSIEEMNQAAKIAVRRKFGRT